MSQANRLKLKKNRELQSKQKYKHGETKKTGTAKRGYRTLYWNQKTGSWQSTKPAALVKKVNIYNPKKPLTRAEKLKKGMATWNTKKGNEAIGTQLDGSKMVKKTETPKPEVKKEAPKPEVKKEAPQEKLKTSYRRTKGEGIGKGDTRITKKLKKAGFTETRLAKLRKKHAEFKEKRKKKKK